MLRSVLFPQPLPPRITKVSSGRTLKLIPFSTVRPFGKVLVILITSRIGAASDTGESGNLFCASAILPAISRQLKGSNNGICNCYHYHCSHHRLCGRFTDLAGTVANVQTLIECDRGHKKCK